MSDQTKTEPRVRESFTIAPKRPNVIVAGTAGDASVLDAAPTPINPAPAMGVTDSVPDQKIAETLADNNSKYLRIDASELPSKGMFYDFTALSIRKFEFDELKKLCRGQASSDLRTVVSAVGATIDRNIMKLTLGDYWFLMFWHRINSFIKSPLEISFTCVNEAHVARTKLPEDDPQFLEEYTLHERQSLGRSNLSTLYIEDQPAIARHIAQVHKEHGILLYPGTVASWVEGTELMDGFTTEVMVAQALAAEESDNKEERIGSALAVAKKVSEHVDEEWLNDNASVLHESHGLTLKDRRNFLLEYTKERGIGYDLSFDIDEFYNLIIHGMSETVFTHCRGCGANTESLVRANALTFFPALF